jgi:hypothetical protein
MASTGTVPRREHRAHRWYYTAVGLGVIVAAVAGFAPSLVYPERRLGPISLLAAVHGLAATAWVVLFIAQSWLVAARRTAVHRRLGWVAVGIAVAMLVLGYLTVIEQTRRGYDLSGDLNIKVDPAGEAVFPLGDLVTFAVLVGAALWHRRRPELHKRLMVLGTVGAMMPSAIAHIVGHNFPTMPVLVVAMIAVAFFTPAVYDRIRFGRFHRVTLWGGFLLFVWANFRAIVIRPSGAWHEFMGWLAQR